MNRLVVSLLSLIALALTAACGTTAKFIYPHDPHALMVTDAPPGNKPTVAVVPFEEMRGARNSSGTYFLYMIPLSPFGWGTYERPDAARMFNSVAEFNFDPSEDLAKAAAYSLRKSNLFEDAYFTFGGEKQRADMVLEGEILSTTYKGTLWTYGLSVCGPILWVVGLPVGTSRNDLALSMKLSNTATGEQVWTGVFTLDKKIMQWLYFRMGHDVQGYSELMQEIMNQALTSMRQEIAASSL